GVGHDEYWSREMRAQVDAFVDGGGNVAFFSANVCWFKVRFDSQNRVMTCYKNDEKIPDPRFPLGFPGYIDPAREWCGRPADPCLSSDPPNATGLWRKVARPENSTTGVSVYDGAIWIAANKPVVEFQVCPGFAGHWVFEGTGLTVCANFGAYANGQSVVGYEVDSKDENSPANF